MSWFDDNGITTQPVSSAPTAGAMPMTGASSFGTGPDVPGVGVASGPMITAPTASAPTAGTAPLIQGGSQFTSTSTPDDVLKALQAAGLQPGSPQANQIVQQYTQAVGNAGQPLQDGFSVGQYDPTRQKYYLPGTDIKYDPSTSQWGSHPYGPTGGSSGGSLGGGPTTVGGVSGIDPSYGFRFQQGLDALQKSAASRGTLLTGGTLKAINDYGQQAASQEYAAANQRTYQLAALGENAAAQQGNFGSNYANNAANTITGGANAQAGASLAQGNIGAGTVSNLGSLALLGSANGYPPNYTNSGYVQNDINNVAAHGAQ